MVEKEKKNRRQCESVYIRDHRRLGWITKRAFNNVVDAYKNALKSGEAEKLYTMVAGYETM